MRDRAREIAVGFLIVHEPLRRRIEYQLSAGAIRDIRQVADGSRQVALQDVAVEVLHPPSEHNR